MNTIETVETFFNAIESLDTRTVSDMYADDVSVWHNFSNAVQTKAENVAVLTGLCGLAESLRYEVIERFSLAPDRIVQRHNLHIRLKKQPAELVVIPACIFITVAGDKITKIEEYLDTAQTGALR